MNLNTINTDTIINLSNLSNLSNFENVDTCVCEQSIKQEICLISKEIITNKITLPCKHSYDYEYLFEEIKQQKLRHKNYFKCPYCRNIYHSCIPYYELENIDKLKNINMGTILPIVDCSFNNCKFPANKFKNGNFCWKHYSKSMIVIELCSAICLNGNSCKNKRKDGIYCNVHKNKNSINNTNNND
jgi:hypothetical protein